MPVPTFTQSPNSSPQPRQSHRTLWIVLGSAIGVLIFAALVTGAVFVALHTFFQQTDQPVPVAANYGLAFMRQDYASAYADLDSQATINGQKVDEQTFRHLATTADAQQGKVTGYSLDGSNSASLFTMTVHRGDRTYQVHLQLKLEGSGWKIISVDGI
jgi:flagellar basal body-associated protein FliL